MKNKKIHYFIYCSIIIALFNLSGCKKDQDTVDTDVIVASDCYIAENYFSDVKNIVDEAGFKNGVYTGILNNSCVAVQFDSLNNLDQDTITIDFGTVNCSCIDGRVRKGKIIIFYSGHYADTNKLHNITFNNYFSDGNQISGIIKDYYLGYNTTGHMYFKDTVSGSIRYLTRKSVYWNGAHTLEFISGDSTATWEDNVMSIHGNASGYSSNALSFSSLIYLPLTRNFSLGCRKNLTQGAIQIASYGKVFRSVDFGSGTCDGNIIVTIDGKTYPVTIN